MISIILEINFAFAKLNLDKIVHLHKKYFTNGLQNPIIQLIFNDERQ